MTAVGNVRLSTTQSKFGGTSAYFDGNGDYIYNIAPDDFHLGVTDFTVECWAYIDFSLYSSSDLPHIFQFGSSLSNRWNLLIDTLQL